MTESLDFTIPSQKNSVKVHYSYLSKLQMIEITNELRIYDTGKNK